MNLTLLSILGCAASGPLPDDVYVWQRSWTPAVRAAVVRDGPTYDRLAVLIAEVSGRTTAAVEVPAETIDRPVVAVLRVGAGPPDVDRLVAVASEGVARLERAGAEVVELQVDYDAGSLALDAYRGWLGPFRDALPVPVTITALPDWLDRPGLPALLGTTDGWTLQLHALVPPATGEPVVPLFRADFARDAVLRAAELGRPFRIALPTCGYTLAFDPDGRFLGASAERPIHWRPDVRTERLVPDPAELAAFVAELGRRHPPELAGRVWFRLPTADDTLAWSPATLAAVRDGRAPAPTLVPGVTTDGALAEVRLANRGDGPGIPTAFVVRGPGAPVALDAYRGWRGERDGSAVRFVPTGGDEVAPAEDRAVGWVRFPQAGEVTVDGR